MRENIGLKRDIRNNLTNANGQYEEGLLYLYAGRHEQAASTFRSLIDRQPCHVEAYLSLGVAYGEMNQPIEMNFTLQEMLKLHPDAGTLHLSLGIVQSNIGRYDSAINHLTTATSLRPGDATAYYLLARAYLATNQRGLALGAVGQVLQLVPNHFGASLLLTKCILGLSVITFEHPVSRHST